MLIARAPLRISFGGGGTDLAAYYTRYGGLVVSAAINRYCLVVLDDNVADLQIISSDYATFHRQSPRDELEWDGDLGLPKAVVHHFGVRRGLNVFLASEVPPGTGLGSSSAMTVAMVTALTRYTGGDATPKELAELGAYLEIDKLGSPIGKQDHYAAAFGGLNVLSFHASGVEVQPLGIRSDYLAELERSLILLYTCSSRNSSTILRQQRRATERQASHVMSSLHAIKSAGLEMRGALESGDLERFGRLLDFAWTKKKALSASISNLAIDNCYRLARSEGAWGGKITGAGGGGFLLLAAPEQHHDRLTALMEENGLRRMDFRFDFEGAKVVYDGMRSEAGWPGMTLPPVADLSLARQRAKRNGRHRAPYNVVAEGHTVSGGPARRRGTPDGSQLDEEVS